MTDSSLALARELLRDVGARLPQRFAGLGVVFYSSLADLPHMPLVGPDASRPSLPVADRQQVVRALLSAADTSSKWHDGFHFVCSATGALTHMSQFIAPPVLVSSSFAAAEWPTGARQAAAVMTSQVPGVDCVGLVGLMGAVSIYVKGRSDPSHRP